MWPCPRGVESLFHKIVVIGGKEFQYNKFGFLLTISNCNTSQIYNVRMWQSVLVSKVTKNIDIPLNWLVCFCIRTNILARATRSLEDSLTGGYYAPASVVAGPILLKITKNRLFWNSLSTYMNDFSCVSPIDIDVFSWTKKSAYFTRSDCTLNFLPVFLLTRITRLLEQ